MTNHPTPFSRRQWRLFFGLFAGFGSWPFVLAAFGFPTAVDEILLFVAGLLAGCMLGMFWWQLLVNRQERITVIRGVFAGLATAVSTIPLTWYLFALFSWFLGLTIDGEPTVNPVQAIPWTFVLVLMTIPTIGMVSALLGAIAGGLMVLIYHKVSGTAVLLH